MKTISKNFHNWFYFEKKPMLTPNLSNFAKKNRERLTHGRVFRVTNPAMGGIFPTLTAPEHTREDLSP